MVVRKFLYGSRLASLHNIRSRIQNSWMAIAIALKDIYKSVRFCKAFSDQ